MSGRRIFLLLLGILLLFAYLMVVLVRGDEGPPKSGIRAERVSAARGEGGGETDIYRGAEKLSGTGRAF